MSIESKHAYRFEYLKSDKWKNVRLEALVRERGKCQICSVESIHHDAHHMWYPESIWDTTPDHLIVLCRACHDFIHTMVPECKTNDEIAGREHWTKFQNAIIAWRSTHSILFTDSEPIVISAQELRAAYKEIKSVCKAQKEMLVEYQKKYGVMEAIPGVNPAPKGPPVKRTIQVLKEKRSQILKELESWFEAFCEKEILTEESESETMT